MPLTRISSSVIQDGTIQTADIADNAITTAKIATGAVVTADLADLAVTVAKLAATLDLSSKSVTLPAAIALPAGAVMPFAMNAAPSGWLAADGAAVSRSTYATLFAAIGTAHGTGDGSTTFNLPDLRGIFVRGSGSQTVGGTAFSGTFATKQADGLRDHSHTWKYNASSTPGGAYGINNADGAGAIKYDIPMTSGTAATETRPANIALLYCIKF